MTTTPIIDDQIMDGLMSAVQGIINGFADVMQLTAEAAEDLDKRGFPDTTMGRVTFSSEGDDVEAVLTDDLKTITIAVRDTVLDVEVLRIVGTPLQ